MVILAHLKAALRLRGKSIIVSFIFSVLWKVRRMATMKLMGALDILCLLVMILIRVDTHSYGRLGMLVASVKLTK